MKNRCPTLDLKPLMRPDLQESRDICLIVNVQICAKLHFFELFCKIMADKIINKLHVEKLDPIYAKKFGRGAFSQ